MSCQWQYPASSGVLPREAGAAASSAGTVAEVLLEESRRNSRSNWREGILSSKNKRSVAAAATAATPAACVEVRKELWRESPFGVLEHFDFVFTYTVGTVEGTYVVVVVYCVYGFVCVQ